MSRTLQEGKQTTRVLLGLALFLVFVVMAVQYESLRNPLIIMISIPFAAIGVAILGFRAASGHAPFMIEPQCS